MCIIIDNYFPFPCTPQLWTELSVPTWETPEMWVLLLLCVCVYVHLPLYTAHLCLHAYIHVIIVPIRFKVWGMCNLLPLEASSLNTCTHVYKWFIQRGIYIYAFTEVDTNLLYTLYLHICVCMFTWNMYLSVYNIHE